MTDAKNFLGKIITVTIDCPLGSKHPKHDFEYTTNYGYLAGTVSPDGEELDAYVLGVKELVEVSTGHCIAVIHRTNGDDDKLVVVPQDITMADEEIRSATYFQERRFESAIIR